MIKLVATLTDAYNKLLKRGRALHVLLSLASVIYSGMQESYVIQLGGNRPVRFQNYFKTKRIKDSQKKNHQKDALIFYIKLL